MHYLKPALWAIFVVLVGALFHYTLPSRDIVRIADTSERRIDYGANSPFWANSGSGNATDVVNRDVFFIQTIRENGSPMVYRNEDTGWGWPPYFKFNTNNLQARAADLRSTAEAPRWVAVTHYGWRIELFSIFPNAVGIKEVAGPDVRLIPWVNIVIVFLFVCLVWGIRVRWNRFWDKRAERRARG